jgi:hypothetical protein
MDDPTPETIAPTEADVQSAFRNMERLVARLGDPCSPGTKEAWYAAGERTRQIYDLMNKVKQRVDREQGQVEPDIIIPPSA